MTGDVRIGRCSVRIRRRGGWSWGPDPQALVGQALAAVEAAVLQAMESRDVPADRDVVVPGPLAVRLHGDLRAQPDAVTAIAEAITRAVNGSGMAGQDTGGGTPTVAAPSEPPAPASAPTARRVTAPLLTLVLARWLRTGRLATLLAGWSDASVAAWARAVGEEAPQDDAVTVTPDAVARMASAIFDDGGSVAAARDAPRAYLLLVAAVAAAHDDRPPGRATQAALHREVEHRHGARPAPIMTLSSEPAGDRAPVPSPDDAVAVPRRRAAPPAPVPQVLPALPLLVVAQLARLDYLDVAAAALGAAGLHEHPGVLGAALAAKVLPPPERGWRRHPAEHGAMAVAAGSPSIVAPDAFADLARLAGVVLDPLRSALETAYALGRAAGEPVTVVPAGGAHLVTEAAGGLPIAWPADPAELTALLALLGNPSTDTSGAADAEALAAALQARSSLRPPGAPTSPHEAALERHLGVAAGTALGLLAADLWGEREDTTPLLALERLTGLESHVTVSDRDVVVRLPLGQRWLDLRRGGALRDAQVPWLPGRTLRFTSW